MLSTVDIVAEPYLTEQHQVEDTLHAIMDAVGRKAFDELAAFHLNSPKFTKFDDFEPLDRQDIATTNRSEREGLGGIENFAYDLRDLKIDVFGSTAVATFLFDYRFDAEGEPMAPLARTTMVFVHSGDGWLIVHEHLSPLKSNP